MRQSKEAKRDTIKSQFLPALPQNTIAERLPFFPAAAENFPVIPVVIPPHQIVVSNLHGQQAMRDGRIA